MVAEAVAVVAQVLCLLLGPRLALGVVGAEAGVAAALRPWQWLLGRDSHLCLAPLEAVAEGVVGAAASSGQAQRSRQAPAVAGLAVVGAAAFSQTRQAPGAAALVAVAEAALFSVLMLQPRLTWVVAGLVGQAASPAPTPRTRLAQGAVVPAAAVAAPSAPRLRPRQAQAAVVPAVVGAVVPSQTRPVRAVVGLALVAAASFDEVQHQHRVP